MSETADSLFKKAERLSNGKKGYSDVEKPGYLRHASGRWRSVQLHDEIIGLYTQVYSLDPADSLSIYRRALEKLNVGDAVGAEADFIVLQGLRSPYAEGLLPIKIFLQKGDRETAKKYLDAENVKNAKKGAPKYKLSDFPYPF